MRRWKLIAAVVAAVVLLASCQPSLIKDPKRGEFRPVGTVEVNGAIPENLDLGGTLEVNGIATAVAGDRSWTQSVPSAAEGEVTTIEAIYTEPDGTVHRQRSAVVTGPSLGAFEHSTDGVGLAFTNTGLDGLGGVINDLAGGAFDIGPLLLAQNPLIHQENAFAHIDITGNAYEAGLGKVSIDATSTASGVRTDITVKDLYIGVELQIQGFPLNNTCRLELEIPTTTIGAFFDLAPDATNPSQLDVTMVGQPAVTTSSVGYEFISGICDGDIFLIGDIVNAVAGPQVQNMVADGFGSQLGDPDGAGPLDSPIAAAIETALAEISIAGPVGEAVQASLDAPFTEVSETDAGIFMKSDANFLALFGDGPGQCQPPEGARRMGGSFDPEGVFPTMGATTPGGDQYGLGLNISASAFNQLLGAMTECGLLNQDITDFELVPGLSLPINSTLLAGLIPAFASLPADTPMVIRLDPSYSPYLTADAGPNGEAGELNIADLWVKFIEPRESGDVEWLTLAVDAPLGFDLGYDASAGALAPTITPPNPDQVDTRVIGQNRVGADEVAVEQLFPNLFPSFVGGLSDSFAAFPLPAFMGMEIEVVEVARQGSYFTLFANLNPTGQTRVENMQVTDLSTGDYVTDGAFDAYQWRHRIRPVESSAGIKVDYKGMLGADACCFTGSRSADATASYRMTFDVVPADGETWRLDLNHLIRGSHDLLDEDLGGGNTAFQTPVNARARVGGGSWQSFGFTPNPSSLPSTRSGGYRPFTGSNSLVLTGSTAQTVTVEVNFGMHVHSASTVFPPRAGDEAAIRLGMNDTISNNFTAGEYPGVGNRSIVDDGHSLTVTVTGE